MNGETENRLRSTSGVSATLIDRVCEDFETAWQSDRNTRIEDFVSHLPEAVREVVLRELIALEVHLRRVGGEHVAAAEYRDRFPAHMSVVDAAFALLDAETSPSRLSDTVSPLDSQRVEGNERSENGIRCRHQGEFPERIGRFDIRRVLGSGGFGVVYLAHDTQLDRLVALKVPRSERLALAPNRESFLHEARIAAKLKHPALVTVHDVREEEGLICIVEEYIEGQNLTQWAAAQPRSWNEVVHVLIEIAEALAYLHQKSLWHRDLKPGNILIDTDGHSHLADFGLAINENSQELLKGQVAGTPGYMSPEQTRGETHWVDGRTDIWSLGVILYELLCGQRPFDASKVVKLFAEIQERDPKPPSMKNPAVPRELERICFKAMSKRIAERYATAKGMADDLRRFLDHTESNGGPPPNPVAKFLASFKVKWRSQGCTVSVSLFTAVCLLVFVVPWSRPLKPPPDHTDETPTIIVIEPEGDLDGTVDVRLSDSGDERRRDLSITEKEVLPLRPGDRIRVLADTNRPAFIYLIWIGGDGIARPLYPWKRGDWNLRPEIELPSVRVMLSEEPDATWRLDSGAVTETVLLLARESPLPVENDLPSAISGLPLQPMRGENSVIRFRNGVAVPDDEHVSDLCNAQRLEDPVVVTQDLIHRRLETEFDLIIAVSYPNRGE